MQARVAIAYANHEGPFKFNLLTSDDVAKYLSVSNGKTLTTAMEEVGCRKIRRTDGREAQVTMDGRRPRLWAINLAVAKHHIDTTVEDLVALYKTERSGKPVEPPMALPPPTPGEWDDLGDDDGAILH